VRESVNTPNPPPIQNKTFILHTGLSKTATTTLQQTFFPNHPELFYLGKDRNLQTLRECRTNSIYALLNPMLWNHRCNLDIRQIEIDKARVEQMHDASRSVWLASWEELGNRPVTTQLESFKRLKQVFGTVRFMICLRNPLHRIPSEYLQHLRHQYLELCARGRGHRCLYKRLYQSFEHWFQRHEKSGFMDILLGEADVIRESMNVLGKDNVGIFLFEQFRTEPTGFLNAICRFLGVQEIDSEQVLNSDDGHLNSRMTNGQLAYLKKVNRSPSERLQLLFKKPNQRRKQFGREKKDQVSADFEIPTYLKTNLENRTREGNRWLAETFKLPLHHYDYPM
jgi:hypothetical protein